jgi:hypothetical protein
VCRPKNSQVKAEFIPLHGRLSVISDTNMVTLSLELSWLEDAKRIPTTISMYVLTCTQDFPSKFCFSIVEVTWAKLKLNPKTRAPKVLNIKLYVLSVQLARNSKLNYTRFEAPFNESTIAVKPTWLVFLSPTNSRPLKTGIRLLFMIKLMVEMAC